MAAEQELMTADVMRILGVTRQTIASYESSGKLHRIGTRASGRGRPTVLYDPGEVMLLREERNFSRSYQQHDAKRMRLVVTGTPTTHGNPAPGVPIRYWLKCDNALGIGSYEVLLPEWDSRHLEYFSKFLKPGFVIRVFGAIGEHNRISADEVYVDISSLVGYAASVAASKATTTHSQGDS